MCRTGGRRCPGSTGSSAAANTLRQHRSRANRALRQAHAAGDTAAEQAARDRLTSANAELTALRQQHARPQEEHMPRDDHHGEPDPTATTFQTSDATVTNVVHGQMRGIQRDRIDGGITFNGGRFTIGDTPGQSGDVTPPPRHDHGDGDGDGDGDGQQGPHVTTFDTPAGHVTNVVHGDMRGIQAGTITGGLTFNGGRMRIGNPAGHQGDVTPPARNAAPSPQQRSTTADDRDTAATQTSTTYTDGHNTVQAGHVTGGVWINGRRVD